MKNRILHILLALVLVSCFSLVTALPAAAAVAEVWVAPAPLGDDNNAGTATEPFATIQKGIDTVSAPGKVYVAAGTYEQRITLRDQVEVLGAGPDVTFIDGAGQGTVVTAGAVGAGTRLEGFTITGGLARYGGGMYTSGGAYTGDSLPVVNNCIFSGNSAISYGGGMYNYNSSPTLTNCTFVNNTAMRGGGIYNWDASPEMINVFFSANSASSTGGGMDNESSSSAVLTNTVFSGNSADYGGGIYNSWSLLNLADSTISGNSAAHYGALYNDSSTPPAVTNSIIWGNPTDNGSTIYSIYGLNAVYSDIEGGFTGTGNLDIDPQFVAGDLHLAPGSPCIDSGDNDVLPADTSDIDGDGNNSEALPIDLDGGPRISGSVVDMGAYEAQLAAPPVANAGGPSVVNEGESLTLDASNSSDPSGAIVSYDWDLNADGLYDDASGVAPAVTFNDDGTYAIGLKVTGSQGDYDTDSASVTVNDLGPTAALTGDTVVNDGQAASYNASGSTSSPDAIVSYEWDWDYDGASFSPSGDTGVTQSHAWNFGATGNITCTVAVRVTDDDGSTDIATLDVIVVDPPNTQAEISALGDYLDQLVLPDSVQNNLSSSLDAASKALEDPNPNNDVSARNTLEAFINKVEAQRGKKLSDAEADALIAMAEGIIATIEDGS
jgi:hypothetical protein